MELFLNVTLLITGFLFSIAAIGGDKYLKGNEPLYRRITRRGWLSIACLILTLSCGVAKEYLSAKKSAAAGITISSLSNQLKASDTLQRAYQDTILSLQRQLQKAATTLEEIQPRLTKTMYELTSRIPREIDFAIINFGGKIKEIPISSESHSQLRLYGGDEFEYHMFCGQQIDKLTLSLTAGDRTYPLYSENATIRIMGPIGIPLDCYVNNPLSVQGCGMKIIIRSTDATRVRAKYGDLFVPTKQKKEKEVLKK